MKHTYGLNCIEKKPAAQNRIFFSNFSLQTSDDMIFFFIKRKNTHRVREKKIITGDLNLIELTFRAL